MPARDHVPVLIDAILDAVRPVTGLWVDGTFGAGGYTRALLDAGACRVTGIDRDASVFELAAPWSTVYGTRLILREGTFDAMETLAEGPVDGVVLDIGVSSMQLDQPRRGFSFLADGPLDMRMGQAGPSAADIVNSADEAALADILFQYGEEKASRRIARAIVSARRAGPLDSTRALARIIEDTLKPRPGGAHPATRSFQALRIAVNDELGQLARGLFAAERMLRPGGVLAVVTFHSLEDRVVKRFFARRSGGGGRANRWAPDAAGDAPRFDKVAKPRRADIAEVEANPRARSATLRLGRRTDAPSGPADFARLGLPRLSLAGGAS